MQKRRSQRSTAPAQPLARGSGKRFRKDGHWAINCGATSLNLAQFQPDKTFVRLQSYTSWPLEYAGDNLDAWLRQVSLILRESAISRFTRKVDLVLPGSLFLIRNISVASADVAKEKEHVQRSIASILPAQARNAEYACRRMTHDGVESDYLAIIPRMGLIPRLYRAFKGIGVGIHHIYPAPLLLYQGALANGLPPDGNHLVVSYGGGTTDIILTSRFSPRFRSISTGGAHLTATLQNILSLPYPQAETLKRGYDNHGFASLPHITAEHPQSHLDECGKAIREFHQRLAAEVGRTLKDARFSRPGTTPRKLYLTGPASQTAGFRQTLEQATGLQTDTLPTAAATCLPRHAEFPALGAPGTLHLQSKYYECCGIKPAPQEALTVRIDLAENLRAKQEPGHTLLHAALAATALTAILALALFPTVGQRHHQAMNELSRLQQSPAAVPRQTSTQTAIPQHSALLREAQARTAYLNTAAHARATLSDMQHILHHLGNLWLDTLTLHPLTDADPPKLTFAGFACDPSTPDSTISHAIESKMSALVGMLSSSNYVSTVVDKKYDFRDYGLLHFEITVEYEPPLESKDPSEESLKEP